MSYTKQKGRKMSREIKINDGAVTIDGVEYVKKGKGVSPEILGDTKIVILQRGWVMVGRLERIPAGTGSQCKLHNAAVIRRWGTKNGLGEIAKNGPTKETILDKCHGVVEFDYLTVVAAISCEESAWYPAL
jgi:hypothetical protein